MLQKIASLLLNGGFRIVKHKINYKQPFIKTKKMKKTLILTLGAIVALASCNRKTVEPELSDVSFTTSIQTRVLNNMFEANDSILVKAYSTDGASIGTAKYAYADGKFSSLAAFNKEVATQLSYTAVYPSTYTNFETAFNFVANVDQSSKTNYEMSDLLVAKAAVTAATQPELKFYHAMSNIVLNITGVDPSLCTATFNLKNEASVNIATGTYEGTGAAVAIKPLTTADGFSVIVAPQAIAANTTIATVTVNNVDYNWVIGASDAADILDGYQYGYTMAIDPVTETFDVVFDGMIMGWEQGTLGGTTTGGGNDGGDGGDGTLPTGPIYEYSDFVAALGNITVSSDGFNVESVDFADVSIVTGYGTSNFTFRLWASDNTIRTYASNTITLKAKNGKSIKGVTFSASAIASATVGTVNGKSWSGDAAEVTLTMEKGNNASITINVE